MTTIPRHPVPTGSYDPTRPLNDLLIEQFKHFQHSAANLPPDLRAALPPIPPIEDSEAVSRFIAAVTRAHMSRKKELPRIVPKPIRTKLPGTLSLAAVADATPARPKKTPEKIATRKSATKSALQKSVAAPKKHTNQKPAAVPAKKSAKKTADKSLKSKPARPENSSQKAKSARTPKPRRKA